MNNKKLRAFIAIFLISSLAIIIAQAVENIVIHNPKYKTKTEMRPQQDLSNADRLTNQSITQFKHKSTK